MTKAALWIRVSDNHQDESNQIPDLERFAEHHGYEITERYTLHDVSAWSSNGGHDAALKQALDDAWQGKYSVLVVWSLDRLSRRGVENTLKTLRLFRERGASVISQQESWLNGSSEVQDLLVSFAAWAAKMESDRRSARIKVGLAKRAAEGKPIGRQPGAKAKAVHKRAPRKPKT